jgi:hypothetical protein
MPHIASAVDDAHIALAVDDAAYRISSSPDRTIEAAANEYE